MSAHARRYVISNIIGALFSRQNRSSSIRFSTMPIHNPYQTTVKQILDLEKLSENLYRVNAPSIRGVPSSTNIYGGHLIALAMKAGIDTVKDDQYMHSFHSHFILAGDTERPMDVKVEHLRDGSSFASRAVRMYQNDAIIYAAHMSFCPMRKAPEFAAHQRAMPDVKQPHECQSGEEILKEYFNDPSLTDDDREDVKRRLKELATFQETRYIDKNMLLRQKKSAPKMLIWIKFNKLAPEIDDIRDHHVLASYMTDSRMIGACLLPMLGNHTRGFITSLDHSINIHDFDFKVDEWMLHEIEGIIAVDGRAYSTGRVYTIDGRLVISMTQEGILRIRQNM